MLRSHEFYSARVTVSDHDNSVVQPEDRDLSIGTIACCAVVFARKEVFCSHGFCRPFDMGGLLESRHGPVKNDEVAPVLWIFAEMWICLCFLGSWHGRYVQ